MQEADLHVLVSIKYLWVVGGELDIIAYIREHFYTHKT